MGVSSLRTLWQRPGQASTLVFCRKDHDSDLAAAKAYLCHAIAEGTPLASAVLLHMNGEIKVKGWLPFTARQVIRIDQGFVWSARARNGFTFISGFDQLLEGRGEMNWKLFGLFQVMSAMGPDVSRSASGRMACESVWLPSTFCRPQVRWTTNGKSLVAKVTVANFESLVSLDVANSGRLEAVTLPRWGNPDGDPFGLVPFGGIVEKESTFDGYTIPSQVRVGWHCGTDRFEEGEFFRANITHAEFR